MRFKSATAVAAGCAVLGVTVFASIPAQGATTASAGSRCQATSLRYSLGAVSGTTQRTQVVDLTDKAKFACTLDGFPGVELIGSARGEKDYTWPLVWESARYSTVVLQPGESAHFDLTYLPGSPENSNISVTRLAIIPPGDYARARLAWRQSVLLQDEATRPGTYISPVRPGA